MGGVYAWGSEIFELLGPSSTHIPGGLILAILLISLGRQLACPYSELISDGAGNLHGDGVQR